MSFIVLKFDRLNSDGLAGKYRNVNISHYMVIDCSNRVYQIIVG